jgi:hypothetical protein
LASEGKLSISKKAGAGTSIVSSSGNKKRSQQTLRICDTKKDISERKQELARRCALLKVCTRGMGCIRAAEAYEFVPVGWLSYQRKLVYESVGTPTNNKSEIRAHIAHMDITGKLKGKSRRPRYLTDDEQDFFVEYLIQLAKAMMPIYQDDARLRMQDAVRAGGLQNGPRKALKN